jgi:hypothetical protein
LIPRITYQFDLQKAHNQSQEAVDSAIPGLLLDPSVGNLHLFQDGDDRESGAPEHPIHDQAGHAPVSILEGMMEG